MGELVQRQKVDAHAQPELVLDGGTLVGPVRMILEVRFNRPGHFPYHARSNPKVIGTVIMQGTGLTGPVLDIDGPPGTRREVRRTAF